MFDYGSDSWKKKQPPCWLKLTLSILVFYLELFFGGSLGWIGPCWIPFMSNFSLLDSFYWGLWCIEYWQFILNSNYVGSIIKWNIVITDQVWLCNLWFFFFFWVAVTGTLKGYDQLLNLVLDEAVEFLRGSYFMAYWQLLMRLCVCVWF